ncbi:MAG: glycosyltransferase family 4 protein [Candidatus Limnocylindria bacterium]
MPERTSLLVVIQRYGDVAGGAEAHARMLVRRLAPHCDIEVATTTARDYRTWENAFTAGLDALDGVRVRRFPVLRRRARDFRLREHRAFAGGHTLADERAFIEAQGPYAPELLEHLLRRGRDFDCVLFFTYIYYPAVYGLRLVPERAVLVPTAHDEPAIGLTLYRQLFHAARAIAYNTDEERAMVQRRFANSRIPGEVVGVGVDVAGDARAERFRERYGIEGPLFLYLGRVVQSKGCVELLDFWQRWRSSAGATPATLALLGHLEMEVGAQGDLRVLGQVSDEDKHDAIAACAALIVPSRLESLSLVTLEAWAMGRPTVCSAASPVLASMTRRARAGLPYRSFAEFGEICEVLASRPELGARLGAAGAAFVQRTYTWPAVVGKYLDLFAEVRARNGW